MIAETVGKRAALKKNTSSSQSLKHRQPFLILSQEISKRYLLTDPENQEMHLLNRVVIKVMTEKGSLKDERFFFVVQQEISRRQIDAYN